MCKYEMGPMSIVEDTEWTRFCPQTDRRTDGQTDKVIPVYPPINFVEAGGIMNISIFHICQWETSRDKSINGVLMFFCGVVYWQYNLFMFFAVLSIDSISYCWWPDAVCQQDLLQPHHSLYILT